MRALTIGLIGITGAITAAAAGAPAPAMNTAGEAGMGATQALKLERETRSGEVEIRVIGHSDNAVEVSYHLDVKGNSTTRHSGRTRLKPGVEATLSRVKVSTDGDWCATLEVEQGEDRYTLEEGSCPAS